MSKVGRPSGLIEYNNVVYNNKEYTIGSLTSKGEEIKFVFDTEDFNKIEGRSWHYSSNRYISHGIIIDGKKKELYLHNIIMNRLGFPGKGSKETVDHINRNGLDNRKENLRIISQSEQNLNQSKKTRRIELPEDSGINPADIPKHIWYVKSNGNHGDRFAIEFKTENITWKTTSSKMLLLKEKLQMAIEKLKELYITYPHLNPSNEETITKINELNDSYNKIINLAY